MTPAAFAAFDVIILGDPKCATGTASYINALNILNTTKLNWIPQVNGNIILMGVDNALHAGGYPGAQKLIERGIQFAAADPTSGTGLYYALSCYYGSAAPFTPVPHLDGLGGTGNTFKARNATGNISHIVASHIVFTTLPALTDTDLSNWGLSVHEGFDSWPANFNVLAIASNNAAVYTATDQTKGVPYILVKGTGGDRK